ncbi:ABC transporter permease [Pleomorphomonas diazotrophica]|uniref:ABC transporter permease n=1 Tax=Pleomorphomonas diazotrophica TaxID=1166257 RepID=A0A1I4WEH0_9HYPH|nr:ABC transporter permease subunit [Pleomorphomonas diazotrophica]PKR88972.1 ABC transporter permease [Pleomorphomonas diazotrophica]SFN12038.1 NitT/TauT family transport system permease protein [Pleomorphomonas diazotrophica]
MTKPTFFRHSVVPVLTVIAAIIALWYVAALFMNHSMVVADAQLKGLAFTPSATWYRSWALDKPLLPAPHQVVAELWRSTAGLSVTSKRSLVYHGWVTLSATLLGFLLGTLLGIFLAIGIVHQKVMDKSLMPWIIASQTVPILAVAPMLIVVLNAIGISGLLPKALISTYLSFFPVVVGMVKGLRSPEAIHLDLMRTYNADDFQVFTKLRWPASVPFLFASLKVGIAISLIGAIVGELPTGAVAGLGARLLSGSYYGQTIQIWAALFAAAFLAGMLVLVVGWSERIVMRLMGARPERRAA